MLILKNWDNLIYIIVYLEEYWTLVYHMFIILLILHICCLGIRAFCSWSGIHAALKPWMKSLSTLFAWITYLFFSLLHFSAPKSGPRNLQVYNATSHSLTVKWDPASGRVQRYRIIYQPISGDGPEQSVTNFDVL